MKMAVDRDQALHMGIDQGYRLLAEDEGQRLIRLIRNDTRIDIWYSKMTVGIMKFGQKTKYHKHVTEEKLDTLLGEG